MLLPKDSQYGKQREQVACLLVVLIDLEPSTSTLKLDRLLNVTGVEPLPPEVESWVNTLGRARFMPIKVAATFALAHPVEAKR